MRLQETSVTPVQCCPGKGGYSILTVHRRDVSELVELSRVRFSGRMHVCRGCGKAQFDKGGLDDAHALIIPPIIEGKIPMTASVVRYVRARLDLSQGLLSSVVGASRATVQRWESGGDVQASDAALMRALLAIHFAETGRSDAVKLRRLEIASRAFDRTITRHPSDVVVIGRGLEFEVPS